jgi:hypothetical protein
MNRIIELLLNGPLEMMDSTLTSGGLFFLIVVVFAFSIFAYILSKRKEKWIKHILVLALGVFIFEVFTSPMWVNNHFGNFGYIYQDVSWVLTLGWTTLMLSIILIVDTVFHNLKEWQRFLLYIVGMGILGFLAEMLVINLGLRSYSPEVLNAIRGGYIFNTPLDALYYIPVFSALVIGFYKYWEYVLEERALVPVKGKSWLRRLLISIVGVFLFEFMIEAMVINANFPEWSYIYNDISVILTTGWVVIMWSSIYVVERFWPNFSLTEKFFLSVVIVGIFAWPFESFLINNGYRIYEGTSAGNAFSGVYMPILNLPAEVALAIPIYFALVIGFVRAWDSMLANRHVEI